MCHQDSWDVCFSFKKKKPRLSHRPSLPSCSLRCISWYGFPETRGDSLWRDARKETGLSLSLQISELHLQSRQLEDENGMLLEKNAQSAADAEVLRQKLAELMRESQRREALPAEEKSKVSADCAG